MDRSFLPRIFSKLWPRKAKHTSQPEVGYGFYRDGELKVWRMSLFELARELHRQGYRATPKKGTPILAMGSPRGYELLPHEWFQLTYQGAPMGLYPLLNILRRLG